MRFGTPTIFAAAALAGLGSFSCSSGKNGSALTLLNASYDPTRELYQEFNAAFAKQWAAKTGQTPVINQSHGGSGKQARAVIDGLEADVVTLALGYDVDAIAARGLLSEKWQERQPNNSAPYTSAIVFLVRKGNSKNIHDWPDLIKEGVQVITPNPKTSGGARWNYLAAYGWALRSNDNDASKALEFVRRLYQQVPVLDSGARGATTTFVERQVGDVLIAWESEALLAVTKLGPDRFEVIYPPLTILAEPPIAVVDKVVDHRHHRALAEAYLAFHYSDEGQLIIAKQHYRPRSPTAAAAVHFPELKTFTVAELGGWTKVQTTHFADGGKFDQIYQPGAAP